jgi:hypothetical protein
MQPYPLRSRPEAPSITRVTIPEPIITAAGATQRTIAGIATIFRERNSANGIVITQKGEP